jgi:DNA repair protein RadC
MTYEIISERNVRNPEKVLKPDEVYALVKRYAKNRQEQFIVITLDGAHRPISVSVAFIGTVNTIMVHPREVYCRAIRDMAAGVIVCHNHPSGQLKPSPEDLDITRCLYEAGKIVGIRLIDRLIITKTGFYSFRRQGCFPGDETPERESA